MYEGHASSWTNRSTDARVLLLVFIKLISLFLIPSRSTVEWFVEPYAEGDSVNLLKVQR